MKDRNTYRIAGHALGADGSKALTSLLSQLRPYLKNDWSIADPVDADIVIALADSEPPEDSFRGRVVRLAVKPRIHGHGTLHWPPRVSEMLALLSEFVPSERQADRQIAAEPISPQWVVRLDAWPIDLDQFGRDERRVMAALTYSAHDVASLGQATGLGVNAVQRIVARLWHEQLLSRTVAIQSLRPSNDAISPLRTIAQRLGKFLGLGRHA